MTTPDEAPKGSIIVIGHPGNGTTARKDASGVFRLTESPYPVCTEDQLRLARLIYNPEGPH